MSGAPKRLLGDSYEHFALVYESIWGSPEPFVAEAGRETARRESIEPFPGEEVLPGGKTLWTARPRRPS